MTNEFKSKTPISDAIAEYKLRNLMWENHLFLIEQKKSLEALIEKHNAGFYSEIKPNVKSDKENQDYNRSSFSK